MPTVPVLEFAQASGRAGQFADTLSPSRPTPRAWPSSASITANIGFWDGLAGAIDGLGACLVDHDRHRTLRTSVRWLVGFHAMDQHFRTRHSSRICPCSWDLTVWNTTSSMRRRLRVLPYEQYLKRFPAYPAATDDGEQARQTRDAPRGTPRRLSNGALYWGSRYHGQHSFYQLIHQEHRWSRATSSAFARR